MYSNSRGHTVTLIDICSYAVKEALKQNANEAEAYAIFDKESEVFLENSDLKQVKSHRKGSIGIRVFINNSLGFTSINSLDKEKVLDSVSKAIKIAKVSPRDKHNVLPEKSKIMLLEGIYDPNAEYFEPTDTVKYSIEMLNAARSYDPRISVDIGTINNSIITIRRDQYRISRKWF